MVISPRFKPQDRKSFSYRRPLTRTADAPGHIAAKTGGVQSERITNSAVAASATNQMMEIAKSHVSRVMMIGAYAHKLTCTLRRSWKRPFHRHALPRRGWLAEPSLGLT